MCPLCGASSRFPCNFVNTFHTVSKPFARHGISMEHFVQQKKHECNKKCIKWRFSKFLKGISGGCSIDFYWKTLSCPELPLNLFLNFLFLFLPFSSQLNDMSLYMTFFLSELSKYFFLHQINKVTLMTLKVPAHQYTKDPAQGSYTNGSVLMRWIIDYTKVHCNVFFY